MLYEARDNLKKSSVQPELEVIIAEGMVHFEELEAFLPNKINQKNNKNSPQLFSADWN